MIKINCKQELVNFKGEVLKNGESNLIVGDAISAVLGGQSSNPTLAWILGKKFATEDSVDLKAEDVVFLKKEVSENKMWMSVVTGQLMELLDGGVPVASLV